jgi:hypothetical protein
MKSPGAIESALVALFANGTAMPIAVVILAGSVCAPLAAMGIREMKCSTGG